MEKKGRKYGGLIILLLTNIVFAALYFRFLTGEAVYLYTDIGSDSVTSSYPIIAMLQRLVSSLNFSGFSLENGLGASTYSYLLKYLNPVKLPLLFFGGSHIPAGLIAELLIQTNVTAVFSWIFFRRLFKCENAALFAALCWTFSGYITLWSQNLTAGACMACFTILMAALLPVLENPSLKNHLLFALAAALFLLTDYYYCYMSAYFVLFFLVFYSWRSGAAVRFLSGFLFFLKRGFMILGAALFGALLSAFALYPSFAGFASSGRTDSLSSLNSGLSFRNARELFSLLARLFSVNTLGAGNAYAGAVNYYEEAVLSTSILALFAVVYLLFRKKTRLITILALLLAAGLLILKNTGALIQFNSGVMRYSYMAAFAEAIAVGAYIKMLLTEPDVRLFRRSGTAALLIMSGLLLYLAKFDWRFNFTADLKVLAAEACFAVFFKIAISLFLRGTSERPVKELCVKKEEPVRAAGGRAGATDENPLNIAFLDEEVQDAVPGTGSVRRSAKNRSACFAVMLGLLCAELVWMNHPTVYSRRYVTRFTEAEDGLSTAGGSYESIADGGGIREAAEIIRSADGGLYRISAGSDTDDANAGMLFGFPAASVYNNTNADSLTTLTRAFGSCQLSPNHFLADGMQYSALPYLAGKYLIADNSGLSADTPSAALFEKTGETSDGRKAVYENKAALPFGYVYTAEMSAAYAKDLPLPERIEALTGAFYLTDGQEEDVPVTEKTFTDGQEEDAQVTEKTFTDGQEEDAQVPEEAEGDARTGRGDGTFTKTDLLEKGTAANQLNLRKTKYGTVFEPQGTDPYIYYELGAGTEGAVRMLYIRLRSTKFNRVRHMQIFFMTEIGEDPDPADSRLFFLGRGYPELLLMIPDDVQKIRLDFPEDLLDTNVAEISLLESTVFPELFKGLQETAISEVSMEGNRYSAAVEAESGGMLCVPLLYSKYYRAEVNGEEEEPLNINGGLVGIPVKAGISRVVLVWELPYFRIAVILSCLAAAVWIGLMMFAAGWKRSGRRKKF